MVEVLNRPPKKFSWSFSAVDNFHTCPNKYYHQNILKDVSDDTTYRTEGGKVHDILRDAVRRTTPLPGHLVRWQRWIDELHRDGGKVMAEVKYAFTEQLVPCDYFDKNVHPWCRSNIDVLKFQRHAPTGLANSALVWDWKTGRLKPDDDQLMLYAMNVFLRFKSIDYVDAGLIFLKEDTGPHVHRNECTYELRIKRQDVIDWWKGYLPKVRALERAIKQSNFPAIKSGLCRAHCAVTSCEHCGT